jgi:hypothetical protein
MGVAINTQVDRFDEEGVGIADQSARQMSVMVGQVIEFARLRALQAGLNTAETAASKHA